MLSFITRRLGRLVLTVFIISTIIFFVIRVIPGDPARVIAGIDADPDSVEQLRDSLGTDRPLAVQYFDWLWDVLRFDFGESYFSGEAVMGLMLERFPITLFLSLLAFAISLILAIPIGVVSAVRRWTGWDYAGMLFSQLGMAIPSFWLGILLLLAFSVNLRLFPLFGADSFRHFVLPALALAVGRAAFLVRMVRASTIEELAREYVVTAESKGLQHRTVVYRHALRNALLPIITLAGIQFGYLLGGSIIVEQVFSIPGLGRLFLSAIYQRDFPLVQGGVIFIAVAFSLTNFIADILYAVVNPKIRLS
jgi:peptide/nickel transport system permease protein